MTFEMRGLGADFEFRSKAHTTCKFIYVITDKDKQSKDKVIKMKAKLIFAVALVLIAAFALTGAAAAANSASNNADFMHCVGNAGVVVGCCNAMPDCCYDPGFMSNFNANATPLSVTFQETHSRAGTDGQSQNDQKVILE